MCRVEPDSVFYEDTRGYLFPLWRILQKICITKFLERSRQFWKPSVFKIGGEGGIRTHVTPKSQTVFETVRLCPLPYLSCVILLTSSGISLVPRRRSSLEEGLSHRFYLRRNRGSCSPSRLSHKVPSS